MSNTSTLSKYVAKFDGTNYQKFEDDFKSYMQMMGLADAILRKPRFTSAEQKYAAAHYAWVVSGRDEMTDEERTAHDGREPRSGAYEDDEGYDAWWKLDQQAQGTFKLSIEPTFYPAFKKCANAYEMWEKLHEEYDTPNVSSIALDFFAALRVEIPTSSSPRPAIETLRSHFIRLAERNVHIP